MFVRDFFVKHGQKFAVVAPFIGSFASIGSFAASDYSVKAVPSPQAMDLTQVGNVWNYAQSMLQDTLAIVSNNPLLIALLIALPLVGIGIGLFKRIIRG